MYEFQDIWSEVKGNNNDHDSDSTDLDISDVGDDVHSSDLDMDEFCADDAPVFLSDLNGVQQETTMGELMPSSFGSAHLGDMENG